MSSEERLARLGVAHLSGAALAKELLARAAAHRVGVEAWHKSQAAKKPNPQAAKAPAPARDLAPELRARITAAYDARAAATVIDALLDVREGSPAEQALLLSLAQAEHKDATLEQAMTRIGQLETHRSRPAAPPPKKR